jgi:hypothetical protein
MERRNEESTMGERTIKATLRGADGAPRVTTYRARSAAEARTLRAALGAPAAARPTPEELRARVAERRAELARTLRAGSR